jgi:ABC-type dipeptide/oligopeptide/nickel transport system permease component
VRDDPPLKPYLLGRLAFLGLMLFGLPGLTFAIAHVVPGDPARLAAGPDANAAWWRRFARSTAGSAAARAVRPLSPRLAAGDLGESLRSRNPVREDLARLLPDTPSSW